MHRIPFSALALPLAFAVGLALPRATSSAPQAACAVAAPMSHDLQDLLRDGRGSGLDAGSYETFGVGPLPVAWIWVPDGTRDGNGQEIVALHASYVTAGPLAPSVTHETRFVATENHLTLQAFLDWIVANNPHVNDVSELDLRVRDVSPLVP